VLAFVGVIWVLRKGGHALRPLARHRRGRRLVTFGTVAAGVLGAAALSGTPITWLFIGKVFAGAASVVASWSLARRLLRSVVPLIAKIPKVGPLVAKSWGSSPAPT